MADILKEKSYAFALRIVKLCEYLADKKREFVLSRKLLDCGTNIGLFIEESKQGSDRSDFVLKLSLANKESFKSNFLLRLLRDSKYITEAQFESLIADCEELQKLLIASLKTARKAE